jgi:hypothetical protein
MSWSTIMDGIIIRLLIHFYPTSRTLWIKWSEQWGLLVSIPVPQPEHDKQYGNDMIGTQGDGSDEDKHNRDLGLLVNSVQEGNEPNLEHTKFDVNQNSTSGLQGNISTHTGKVYQVGSCSHFKTIRWIWNLIIQFEPDDWLYMSWTWYTH